MSIPESQLERWSHQGAVTNAKNTHQSIRTALEQYQYSWRDEVNYEVYLQGSYKNDTNIRGDSDVDVVAQLNSAFHCNLNEEQRRLFGFTSASYGWHEFRQDVLRALEAYYGPRKVRQGRKSIKVETPYLLADVVVCIQYRKYPAYPSDANDFLEGMTFYVSSESRWVVNYPKLHYQNGVDKNKRTEGLYKPTVRVFKNARTYLVDRGVILSSLAPSYFLECLLYNVPYKYYIGDYKDIFCSVVDYLRRVDLSNFKCQNEQLPLFGNTPEQWSENQARQFVDAMVNLWKSW